MPLLRCANTGLSEIIGPTGRVLAKAPVFRACVLAGSVPPGTGGTLYDRLGDWPGLLAAIMLLSKLFSSGRTGLFALGGFSGLLDVDPITLSMARLAGTSVPVATAVGTILIAAAANGLAKSFMALTFGGLRLGGLLGLSALAAFGAAAAMYIYT